MTEPRDELEDWLRAEVTPLSPLPGALDRIRRRARQRKIRQVVVASAGCAVVLGAAVAVPQLLPSSPSGRTRPVAAADSQPVTQPPVTQPSSGGSPAGPQGSGTQLQQRTSLSTTTSGTTPPPDFRPTSVTFVGTGSGGVVGAVIGHAGPPCATNYCTSLAGTSNYGASWYGVSAPVAPGPAGDAGVSQLRFANLHDGWAFGPALYETSGGGWPWIQEDTYGQRVLDVEAAAGHALAVFGTCTGTGADYAANCTSFTLYSTVAGSTTWVPVQVPAAFAPISSSVAPSLVISGSTGYLVGPSGAVITGPVTGGPWTLAGQAPCKPAGSPAGGFLLAASPAQLLLTCASPSASTSQPVLFTSPNGLAWQQVGPVQAAGTPTAVASAGGSQVVMATTAGIAVSADGGKSWRSASIAASTPADGFAYVGMTNAEQGVAVPADSSLSEVFTTQDGGLTWTPSPIKG